MFAKLRDFFFHVFIVAKKREIGKITCGELGCDAKLAQDFARELFEEGVYVRGFFYPVVAQGQARIRTQMSAGLEKADLEAALKSFIKVGKKLGVLK